MEGSKLYSFIKNGSRNKSINYRPVSLTSVIYKLLETIIMDHIMDFLIKHKLINWQMLFNFGKCKRLHTGPGNTGMNNEMGGTRLF